MLELCSRLPCYYAARHLFQVDGLAREEGGNDPLVVVSAAVIEREHSGPFLWTPSEMVGDVSAHPLRYCLR